MKIDFMQTVNLLTIELKLRVEGSNNLLSLFSKKKSLKESYLFFKTRFSLLLMAEIGQVCRRPVFHDLDLPPFQNNIISVCSYLPEKPIDKNRNR